MVAVVGRELVQQLLFLVVELSLVAWHIGKRLLAFDELRTVGVKQLSKRVSRRITFR